MKLLAYLFLLFSISGVIPGISGATPDFDLYSDDDMGNLPNSSHLVDLVRQGNLPEVSSHQTLSSGIDACTSGDRYVRAICAYMGRYFTSRFGRSNVRINTSGRLYYFDDRTVRKVDTGHSCSHTSEIRSSTQYAYLRSGINLKISGDSFGAPFILSTRLPARVAARTVVRDSFGFKFFGCRRTARDTYTLSGNDPTFANIVVSVALAPTIRRVNSRTYLISVEPRATLMFDLDKREPSMRSSGRSIFAKLYIALTRELRLGLRAVDKVFRGKDLSEAERNALVVLAFQLATTTIIKPPALLSLPGLKSFLKRQLAKKVLLRKQEKQLKKFGADEEDRLNQQISSILRLSNGQKRYILRAR